jgi:chromosome segregation ATPase
MKAKITAIGKVIRDEIGNVTSVEGWTFDCKNIAFEWASNKVCGWSFDELERLANKKDSLTKELLIKEARTVARFWYRQAKELQSELDADDCLFHEVNVGAWQIAKELEQLKSERDEVKNKLELAITALHEIAWTTKDYPPGTSVGQVLQDDLDNARSCLDKLGVQWQTESKL